MSQVACHHLKAGTRVRFHLQGAHSCQLSRGSQCGRKGLVPLHVASPQGSLSVLTSRWLASQSENFKNPGRSCNAFMIQPWKSCHQVSSVTQSCPTLCDPMDCSTPGLSVHHQLLEFTQTHVHWVSDAIQPSHPLSSPSPPAFNLSQHQVLFKWVSSLHQVTKVLEFQLQHQSFQWTFRTDLL